MMKAVRINGYGSTDVLTYEDAPQPITGEQEVLIKVHATSVNPFDCAARAGYLAGWYQYSFPHVLGLDVSGEVVQVGSAVTGFAVGDAVWARADPARNGAYAQFIAVSASEVAKKPASLGHANAAALPHAAVTTWRALVDAAALSKGQTVLIHAAAGGVGTFAVQFAKSLGAQVIGTASTHNLGYLNELGADSVIDYTTTAFEKAVQNVDVVLDLVGGDTQDRSWGVLKPNGILLSVVQQPSAEMAETHHVRQAFVGGYPPAGKILEHTAGLVESGKIKPYVSATFPLHEIRKAHASVETRHTRGKCVVTVA